ncbi:MAG: AAA family ATPase [Sphaerochaeta sp.]|nr:AAA family ATPase [Sphaerochaeta sp.]
MIIDTFTISGYKGFQEKEIIQLDPHMNVFFGKNGSGKSSILYAMMISLSWLPARIRSLSTNGSLIELHDINLKKSAAELCVSCKENGEKGVAWSLYRTKKGLPSISKSDFSDLNKYAKALQVKIEETQGCCNLPIVGLYPVTRAGIVFPSRTRKRHSFDLLSALEKDQIWNADYKLFYEWFRDQEGAENNEKIKKSLDFIDRSLEAVRQAIYSFIPSFSNLNFHWKTPQGLMVKKEGFGDFRIEQLSGGEQCLLTMIGDLARKLAIANPLRENPLDGNGIIFIDEIDLHLHPSWQSSIVDNLKRTFPNCQFIISTHSPFVLSHVNPSQVFSLQAEYGSIRISQGINTYGKESESIYQDFMELDSTRPDEVENKISEIYKLMDTNLPEAEAKLLELQKIVVNDTELHKMQLIIDRKRLLGK